MSFLSCNFLNLQVLEKMGVFFFILLDFLLIKNDLFAIIYNFEIFLKPLLKGRTYQKQTDEKKINKGKRYCAFSHYFAYNLALLQTSDIFDQY